MTKTWNGIVKAGSEAEHEAFVASLASAEGLRLLARSALSGYELRQDGNKLTVLMSADEPPFIIRFLRNPRYWPAFWEFVSADAAQALGLESQRRVAWSKGA